MNTELIDAKADEAYAARRLQRNPGSESCLWNLIGCAIKVSRILVLIVGRIAFWLRLSYRSDVFLPLPFRWLWWAKRTMCRGPCVC